MLKNKNKSKQNNAPVHYWATLCGALLCLTPGLTFAAIFDFPRPGNDIIGEVFTMATPPGQELAEIGRKYDVGGYEMLEANPQVPGKVTRSFTTLTIPRAHILPNAERSGIVINISELRLYYYPADHSKVISFPIGIGREGWQTPAIITKIAEKIVNPTWHVPDTIKAWNAAKGIFLPDSIPPGPDNPLGNFAMRLGDPTILIHGTNAPTSVGWRVSSGCIRMLPQDVAALFDLVTVGTRVDIVDQPFLAGWYDNKLYLEAHLPVQESPARNDPHPYATQVVLDATKNRPAIVDWNKVFQAADEQRGIPVVIGEAGTAATATMAPTTTAASKNPPIAPGSATND